MLPSGNPRLATATYRDAITSGLMGVDDRVGGKRKILVAPPAWADDAAGAATSDGAGEREVTLDPGLCDALVAFTGG